MLLAQRIALHQSFDDCLAEEDVHERQNDPGKREQAECLGAQQSRGSHEHKERNDRAAPGAQARPYRAANDTPFHHAPSLPDLAQGAAQQVLRSTPAPNYAFTGSHDGPALPDTKNTLLPMLRLNQLTFAYDTEPVLTNVSFSVEAGQFAALLGPNGAGKSTLIGLLSAQYRAASGSVHIDGHDVQTDATRALKTLGIVFQSPTLDLDLTVEQNLSYFGGLHGLSPQQTRQRSGPWLERLDLANRRETKVRILSGGQRRRVEIIRALIHGPKILLLDEPTTGLDVPTRQSIVDLVHDLATETGLCVLWATHLVDEVRDTDTLVVLENGRIRDTGPCPDVMTRLGAADLAAIAGGDPQEERKVRAT